MDYKIYLIEDCDGLKYVGSTDQTLNARLTQHRSDKKRNHSCSSKQLNLEDCSIKELEKCNEENRWEREQYWKDKIIDCVNERNMVFDKKEYDKEYGKEYRKKNKEEIKQKKKQYDEKNKEQIKEYKKQYREKNKEEIKQKKKEYREKNKEKIKEHDKEYRQKNKEQIKQKRKEHYQKNKEQIKQKKKEHYQTNKEEIKEQKRDRYIEKVVKDCLNDLITELENKNK